MRQVFFVVDCPLLMALPLPHGQFPDLSVNSLRQSGKMVQALTLYRRLATETLTGCDFARIMRNGAHPMECRQRFEACPHPAAASAQCGTCPTAVRTSLVLDIAHHLLEWLTTTQSTCSSKNWNGDPMPQQ